MSLAVVAGLIVAGKGDEAAEAKAQGEEDLRGSTDPGLGVQQLLQLQKPDETARPLSSTKCPALPLPAWRDGDKGRDGTLCTLITGQGFFSSGLLL